MQPFCCADFHTQPTLAGHPRHAPGASELLQKPEVESPENHDNPDIRQQPFSEPVPEEQKIHGDHQSHHQRDKNPQDSTPAHFEYLTATIGGSTCQEIS
ncbi:hypothetical protein [Deinococcus marmoris]|uniref:hypothetical protein n=1 Tax=Deinococcus marmoris TaxID=249408 RepID=UPI001588DBA9|nr:hypothetical protein [Deinococcus marmoris]